MCTYGSGAAFRTTAVSYYSYYFQTKTNKAISEELGVSHERIRQILAKALRELRKSNVLRQIYKEYRQHTNEPFQIQSAIF
jgi:predicted transcriptional regulator